jgi:hypothetical protein
MLFLRILALRASAVLWIGLSTIRISAPKSPYLKLRLKISGFLAV